MRYFLCSLLLGSALLAQQEFQPNPDLTNAKGTFYVDGISYQYAAGKDYTVVAAAHSVINHKFLAVKLRVYNAGQRSVTVKPEDVLVEDAVAARALAPVSAIALANKMRRPYNMARYAVNAAGGPDSEEQPLTSDMMNPQFLEMMRAMAAHTHGNAAAVGETSSTPTLREHWSRTLRAAPPSAIRFAGCACASPRKQMRWRSSSGRPHPITSNNAACGRTPFLRART